MADTTISSLNTATALSANNFIPISDGTNTSKLGTDSLFGFRNRIINGDMRIDQRNAGTAVSLPAYPSVIPVTNYPVDRWRVWNLTDGTCNIQRSNDAPPGFTNSTSITITSPDTSLTPDQYLTFGSRNEGNMFSDFKFGTQNAKTFTLSFWVKCSLAGVFGGAIRNANSDLRGYPFNFNINSINTWEYKTITIPGDTTGSWPKDNSPGFDVLFSLGVGSTYTGTAGSWVADNVINATGSTSVVSVNGATFNITGVQVELGSTATPFEFRPIGTELALCQRYYEKSYNLNKSGFVFGINEGESSGASCPGGLFRFGVRFAVAKRAVPTISTYDSLGNGGSGSNARLSYYLQAWYNGGSFDVFAPRASEAGFYVGTGSHGIVEGQFGWTADAEL